MAASVTAAELGGANLKSTRITYWRDFIRLYFYLSGSTLTLEIKIHVSKIIFTVKFQLPEGRSGRRTMRPSTGCGWRLRAINVPPCCQLQCSWVSSKPIHLPPLNRIMNEWVNQSINQKILALSCIRWRIKFWILLISSRTNQLTISVNNFQSAKSLCLRITTSDFLPLPRL
jgi:hypothetical protein